MKPQSPVSCMGAALSAPREQLSSYRDDCSCGGANTSGETPRPFALPRVRKVVPEPAHPPGNKDSPCDHQQDR
jgi:hypothetical protein